MSSRNYSDALNLLNSLQSNAAAVAAVRASPAEKNKKSIPEMIEWCDRIGYKPKDFDRLRPIHIAGTKGKGSTSAFVSSILAQYRDHDDSSATASSSSTGPSGSADSRIRKIGLYTSPHLRSVRERIQINNVTLSEPDFAKYFFRIWDRLRNHTQQGDGSLLEPRSKPMYFRYLTLVAFEAFMAEGVDTAVFECGVGGEFDATNVLVHPTVTAVTSLDIDHVEILGSTLNDIAWHKAGIYKHGSRAFTSPQKPEALEVLRERAREKGVGDLQVVDRLPGIDTLKLGLAGEFQRTNASLAVAVAAAHLQAIGHPEADQLTSFSESGTVSAAELPSQFKSGLGNVRLAGRCDVRRENDQLTWYIDGGHTPESVRLAGEWFASCLDAEPTVSNGHASDERSSPESTFTSLSSPSSHKPSSSTNLSSDAATPTIPLPKRNRILIFNQQSRDAVALAKTLFSALNKNITSNTSSTSSTSSTTSASPAPAHPSSNRSIITHAFFCTNVTFRHEGYKPDMVSINVDAVPVEKLSVQCRLAEAWRELDPECDVRVYKSVEEAVEACRAVSRGGGMDENGGVGRDGGMTMALVTGSLHLVGGALEFIEGGGGMR